MNMKFTQKFYKELDNNPIETIQKTEINKNVKELQRLIKKLNETYHEKGENLISDDSYDTLKDYLDKEKLFNFSNIGAPVSETHAVKLPYWMGSMNKMKETNEKEIIRWKEKYNDKYVISDKLDGVSGLFISYGSDRTLYTRGDGKKGRNISHIIKSIKGLDAIKEINCVVRGELIIDRSDFIKLIEDKKLKETSNPRNTVAGLVNSKTKNDLLKYTKFIGYEVIKPENLATEEQMKYLKTNGFEVAEYSIYDDIQIHSLNNHLKKRKTESRYDIDGIIIASNEIQKRNESGNPEYAFAYKLPTNEVDVLVESVHWEISKDRYIKPTVIFEPVYLSGAMLRKASAFNAKYIVDNCIGKGSVITITRSGEVIPYIKRIVKSSNSDMPDYKYAWTKNKVDIVIEETKETSNMIHLKRFQNMLSVIDIRGISDSTTTKLYDNGITTIKDIFDDNLKVRLHKLSDNGLLSSIGNKNIDKIIKSINERKNNLKCIDFMVASNIFGRGFSYKTLDLILQTYPEYMDMELTKIDLMKIKGIGEKSAVQFKEHIDDFKHFIKNNNLEKYCEHNSLKAVKKGKLRDMKILFSGKKDTELIKLIEIEDGIVVATFSKDINYLLMENPNDNSSKQRNALKFGMIIGENILKPLEFKEKYLDIKN